MADTVRCDNCMIVQEWPVVRWLRVEMLGVRAWQDPDAWHFCSDRCLAAFFTLRVESG